jgi:hypothetical protein
MLALFEQPWLDMSMDEHLSACNIVLCRTTLADI